MEKIIDDLNSLYRKLLDLSADAVVVTDYLGIILHYSDSAETLFGFPRQDVVNKHFAVLLPKQKNLSTTTFLRNVVKSIKTEAFGTAFEFVANDSTNNPLQLSLSLGKAKINGKIYYMGVCHDLSDAKKTLTEKLEMESINNALFDAAADGIITIDAQGSIQSFNQAAERLFGYKKHHVVGKNVSTLMPQPFAKHHDNYIKNFIGGGEAKIIGIGRDVPGKRKDGSIFPMRLSVGRAQSEGGPVFIGLCHDLTEYQDALIRLSQAEQRYKSIVESQSQMICRLDGAKKITFVNSAFQNKFNCTNREVIGMNFVNFIRGSWERVPPVFEQLDEYELDTEVHIKLQMHSKLCSFPVEWWFKRVKDEESDMWGYQAFGLDVSAKEEAIQQADFLKTHDPLTGLVNHEEVLQRFPKWAKDDCSYVVLLLDYNHFQLINQTYGYHAANQMLVEASQRIQQAITREAIISRTQADQFVIVVRIADEDDGFHLASNILRCLEREFIINNDRIVPSVRCGVSIYPRDSTDIEQLCRMSEIALEQARNSVPQISFTDKSMQQDLRRMLEIEQGLKVAIRSESIQIHLQPKVCLKSLCIVGFEALARWQDDKLGFVSPAEFISVAEKMNMSIDIDRYIIRKTIKLMGAVGDPESDNIPVAINITSRFFSDPSLFQFICECAGSADVSLSMIHLEITERMLMHVNSQVLFNMKRLREAGVKIAIDDFGTGYSSLSYLRDIHVDELKIDKSFIDNIDSRHGKDIVKAIIAIAKAGNMEVVAEGVENQKQFLILQQMGCEYGQGYYFARPDKFQEMFFRSRLPSAVFENNE